MVKGEKEKKEEKKFNEKKTQNGKQNE